MAKTKKVTYITPPGIAVWPKLDEPDVFTPKKGKGAPKVRYTCNQSWDDKTLAKVQRDIAKLSEQFGDDVGDNENSPFKTDKEDRVSLFATSGEKYKPPLFDSKNRPLPKGTVVGGGSTIRMDVTLNPYDGFGGGVNLYINAIQVIDLVEPTFGKSNFDEIEDGYEVGDDDDGAAKSSSKRNSRSDDTDDEIPF